MKMNVGQIFTTLRDSNPNLSSHLDVKVDGKFVGFTSNVDVIDGTIIEIGRQSWKRKGKVWIELISLKSDAEYSVTLPGTKNGDRDGSSCTITLQYSPKDDMLLIGGMGLEYAHGGYPVTVEVREGEVFVLTWDNEGQVVHSVSLSELKNEIATANC